MKRKMLLLLICVAFMVVGCGDKKMTCTMNYNESGVTLDAKYTVTYKDDYVTKVENVENVTADSSVLDALEESLETQYKDIKKLDFYNVDIKRDGNKLTSKITIDYANGDTSKLVEIEPTVSVLLEENGKVKVSTLKTLYMQMGMTCEG